MWLERRLWVSWFLEWRELREAGFTEQRLPPAPGSGRITGRCLPVPNKTRWVHPKWTITFFVLGFWLSIILSFLMILFWVLLWIFNSFVILSGFLWKFSHFLFDIVLGFCCLGFLISYYYLIWVFLWKFKMPPFPVNIYISFVIFCSGFLLLN